MTMLFDDYVADPASGHFISAKHQRIAEIIQDYNPELHLVWIPTTERTIYDKGKEFAVVHVQQDGKQYPMFFIDENELDHRVIARIFDMDGSKTDLQGRLESLEAAAQLVEYKAWMERRDERVDAIATVLKSPKHTYKLPNGTILR